MTSVTPESDSSAQLIRRQAAMGESQRQIARYVSQLLSGEAANKVLRFAALIVFAHTLSAKDFGIVNVMIAVSGIALVAGSLGLPDLGARGVAVAPERAGWLAGHVATTRVSVLTALGTIGALTALIFSPSLTPLLVMAALMAIFMAASGDWVARGLERMSLVAVANATGGLTVLVGSVAVAKVFGSATAALGAFALAELVVTMVLWIRLYPHARIELGFRGMGAMLFRARALALSSLAIYSYYANLDTIVLAASHSSREAGLYSAPYRLFLVLNLVGVFAAYAMLPTLARLAAASQDVEADRLLRSVLALLGIYGLVTLGLIELIGPFALGALFGASFRAAADSFVLLAAGVAWYAIGYPAGYSLIARGENARFLRGAATASVATIVLDLALIPPLGMKGAGLATLVGFAVGALVWLQARGLLGRAMVSILIALGGTSGLAIVLVFSNASSRIVGVVTLAVAFVLLAGTRIKGSLLSSALRDRA
jgi:O-antigen/teichoic acid export membrane protein